jgi:hypothetical protein
MLFTWLPGRLPAQDSAPRYVGAEVFAGGEFEEYLRYLQLSGEVPAHPWSVRGFGPAEVDLLAPTEGAHPWSARYRFAADTALPGTVEIHALRPTVRAIYNSAFPYGSNDGPLWAGRGLTTSIEAGVRARYGPVSLVLAPMLFRAENADFAVIPNGREGDEAFATPAWPLDIDLPQRFGDDAYTRLDPGQSTLRVDAGSVAFGLSTANQWWGPTGEHPFVLGNNAAGFAHLFLGTARPVGVGIGRVLARYIVGRLDQSPFATTSADSAVRWSTGLVGSFSPAGLEGLELGAARLYQMPWPDGGPYLEDLLRPFSGLTKNSSGDRTDEHPRYRAENQLASIFFRWVASGGGFETYGEFGREDHNADTRDFILEPDHQSSWALGFRKAWSRGPTLLYGLRAEVVNSAAAQISQVRPQGPLYRHTRVRQGHTQIGQALGSAAVFGGGGAIVAVDRYSETGRWSIEATRELRDEQVRFPDPSKARDGRYGLGTEWVRFREDLELGVHVGVVYNRDRNPETGRFNLNLSVAASRAL